MEVSREELRRMVRSSWEVFHSIGLPTNINLHWSVRRTIENNYMGGRINRRLSRYLNTDYKTGYKDGRLNKYNRQDYGNAYGMGYKDGLLKHLNEKVSKGLL
jgi:hypothetical protein